MGVAFCVPCPELLLVFLLMNSTPAAPIDVSIVEQEMPAGDIFDEAYTCRRTFLFFYIYSYPFPVKEITTYDDPIYDTPYPNQ